MEDIKVKNMTFDCLSEDWTAIEELIVYGFGRVAQNNMKKIINDFRIPFIIDNDSNYAGNNFHNIPIMSLDSCKDILYGWKILILAQGNAYDSIRNSLMKMNLKENMDFCGLDLFMREWYWKNKKQVCMSKVGCLITTRCTLQCKNCAHFIPYHKKKYDFSLEVLMKDVESLFSLVDYVTSFAIAGGEPFLYKELIQFINYVNKNYSSKMGNLRIVTNGTVIPHNDVLECMEKNNVDVQISDYALSNEYDNTRNKLCERLNEYGIPFQVVSEMEWLDMGFPFEVESMGENKEDIRSHMLQCNSLCHGIHNGRYYYCMVAVCAELSGKWELKDDDSMDIRECSCTDENKEKLLQYQSGNMKEGYMSFCKVCRGWGADNNRKLRAGIQIEQMR